MFVEWETTRNLLVTLKRQPEQPVDGYCRAACFAYGTPYRLNLNPCMTYPTLGHGPTGLTGTYTCSNNTCSTDFGYV